MKQYFSQFIINSYQQLFAKIIIRWNTLCMCIIIRQKRNEVCMYLYIYYIQGIIQFSIILNFQSRSTTLLKRKKKQSSKPQQTIDIQKEFSIHIHIYLFTYIFVINRAKKYSEYATKKTLATISIGLQQKSGHQKHYNHIFTKHATIEYIYQAYQIMLVNQQHYLLIINTQKQKYHQMFKLDSFHFIFSRHTFKNEQQFYKSYRIVKKNYISQDCMILVQYNFWVQKQKQPKHQIKKIVTTNKDGKKNTNNISKISKNHIYTFYMYILNTALIFNHIKLSNSILISKKKTKNLKTFQTKSCISNRGKAEPLWYFKTKSCIQNRSKAKKKQNGRIKNFKTFQTKSCISNKSKAEPLWQSKINSKINRASQIGAKQNPYSILHHIQGYTLTQETLHSISQYKKILTEKKNNTIKLYCITYKVTTITNLHVC
eukprot:TRINITY_DN3862_c0_g1_i1.p1 TRINITY_DN3862_c0_g1~~TRINITY_DN3862_c0_g1_i1.p1  ORF type:complete len:429 (+),score=-35.22 TRINITY_DN3862_c0_g1_i1:479-1765(+)